MIESKIYAIYCITPWPTDVHFCVFVSRSENRERDIITLLGKLMAAGLTFAQLRGAPERAACFGLAPTAISCT